MAVVLLDLGSLEPGCGAGALGQGCASQQAQGLQAPQTLPAAVVSPWDVKPDPAPGRLQSSHTHLGINILFRQTMSTRVNNSLSRKTLSRESTDLATSQSGFTLD